MKKQGLTLALLVTCYNVAASELASVAAGGVLATALACNVVVPGMPAEKRIPVSKAEIVAGATSVVAGAASVICVHTKRHDVAAAFGITSLLAAYKKYSFVRMRTAKAQQDVENRYNKNLTAIRVQVECVATELNALVINHDRELARLAAQRSGLEASLAQLQGELEIRTISYNELEERNTTMSARTAAQRLQLETSNAQLRQQIDHAANARSFLDARNAELREQLEKAAVAAQDAESRYNGDLAQLRAQVASLVAPRDVATQERGTQSSPCVADRVVSGRSASFNNSQRSTPRSPLAAAAAAACSEPMSGCVTTPSPALINEAAADHNL